MLDLYITVLSTLLHIALPYAITRIDRQRLTPVQLERAWNTASWASAIYFFGPLSLPAHFWVTRRSWRGLAMGSLALVLAVGIEWLAATALEFAVGS